MPLSTTFTCPNCDEDQFVVLLEDVSSATVTCPNCDEQIILSFGTN